MKRQNPLIVITLIFSIVALFLEQLSRVVDIPLLRLFPGYIDYAVLLLIVAEIVIDFRNAPYKRVYLRRSAGSLAFATVFIGLFFYSRFAASAATEGEIGTFPMVVIIIRNIFMLLRVFSRLRRLSAFLEEISSHPAQTILASFFIAILAGALLLMMPFTHAEGAGLPVIDAFFTATSAVCVTGLVVVDTASAFTVYGKMIILILIQAGGLGIMLLSYFTVFIFRRSVSIRDKMLISYLLSERDMTKLGRNIKTIIYTTLVVEAAGAFVLAIGLHMNTGAVVTDTIFSAVFHSISAFCNAGFSLYSDSLEGFRGSPEIILPIAILIIGGGLSFAVITDVRRNIVGNIRRFLKRKHHRVSMLSLNSLAVLTTTSILLVGGILLFYGLEYRNEMANESTAGQYLSAFFQSVTLRTAGFNSVGFSTLLPATYLVMCVFMFIGGASGSTAAGGIKVNTVTVMFSYLSSTLREKDSVVLYRKSIDQKTVARAFLILLFGMLAITVGTILLAIFEPAPIEHLIFETVSAFGTVGLSAGVTAELSVPGKLVIIILMYIGRLGPLTILAAASAGERPVKIEYPRGQIAIG